MRGKNFETIEEVLDLRDLLTKAKRSGATSGGVFGSRVNGSWVEGSDVDVVINDSTAPLFGDITHEEGERSGTRFHVFRKKPGFSTGKSRYEEILNTAETEQRKLFSSD